MRKTLYLLITLIVISCNTEEDAGPGVTNTFVKLFGGPSSDLPQMALQTSDNGFIILSTTVTENDDGTESNQIRLIKTDANGNTSWDRLHPAANSEEDLNYVAKSLTIKDDGGYLIIGDRIYPSGKSGILLLDINPENGEEVMSNTILFTPNNDTIDSHGVDLLLNDNGELKITGRVSSASNNIFLGTLNPSNLTVIPECSFRYSSTSTNPDIIRSLNMEANGDLVFGAAVSNNSRLIRVPPCQNSQITGPFIQSTSAEPYRANQIVKGATGYALVGTTNENSNLDIFLARVNDLGDNAKITIYNEINGVALSEEEQAFAITSTRDGGFIFGGSTESSTKGETDMIVVKTDFLGNVQWSERYGDQNEESVRYIQQTNDGGYIILGATEFGGIDTITLIKTDKDGKVN